MITVYAHAQYQPINIRYDVNDTTICGEQTRLGEPKTLLGNNYHPHKATHDEQRCGEHTNLLVVGMCSKAHMSTCQHLEVRRANDVTSNSCLLAMFIILTQFSRVGFDNALHIVFI